MRTRSFKLTEKEEARLKELASKLGYIYNNRPSISRMIRAIGQGELKIFKEIS